PFIFGHNNNEGAIGGWARRSMETRRERLDAWLRITWLGSSQLGSTARRWPAASRTRRVLPHAGRAMVVIELFARSETNRSSQFAARIIPPLLGGDARQAPFPTVDDTTRDAAV